MRLGKGGIRQFEFIVIDGMLYPYFFGSKLFSVYPDLQVKKKIFNHENTVFKLETAALFKNAINWMTIITLALGIIFTAIGSALVYHAYYKNTEVTLTANQGAITCSNTLGTMVETYGQGVSEYLTYQQSQIDNIKKNEIPSNTIPSINDIIIDPTKITK